MIPFIRSITELMVITEARDQKREENEIKDLNNFLEEDKRTIGSQINKYNKKIELPTLPKSKRRKWIKGKEAVSRFLDKLDYNNQIQSTYDLTLMETQSNNDTQDVA